jgi:hypothetical protein
VRKARIVMHDKLGALEKLGKHRTLAAMRERAKKVN